MTDNVINMFKNKQKNIVESVEPLTDDEIESFKQILLNSVDNFHSLSVMEKYALYSENVNLIIILMDILDGKYVTKEEELE